MGYSRFDAIYGELIEFKEEWVGERKKKVYNLTQKGYDLFNLLTERQSRIFNSLFSLMNQILPDQRDDNKDEMFQNLEMAKKLSPISPDFDFLNNKSTTEKIAIMTNLKYRLSQQVAFFQEMVKNLDIRIDLLKNS